ncbi:uncharacterized protein LOC113552576 [Rhopalosiphum maidis]|uniref:uncharacterized protein LOC113552576 n=1 Tax=Rhopalosiphum maidis TaxID=43146 RepID=UPI000EFDD78F|nr:uncharacterized protein LOC113552576 [Rhopalosiphum maidis]
MASNLVKMAKFNNGQLYPILGLGTWQASTVIDDSQHTVFINAIKSAIDIGYRHFDCAAIYNNEKLLGKAINDKILEGVVKRDELFITSKLWNDKHRSELVEEALKNTLNDLCLSYVDLYLIHWPFGTSEDPNATDSEGRLLGSGISYLETWKAMEECVQKGLTKSIGVSNFNIRQLKDILEIATIKPVVNQVECHPYLTQNKLKEFCESNGILLTGYAPLGSAKRSWAGPEEDAILDEPIVKQLADKYKKTNAQILIKFQIQRGVIVIPKSSNPKRQKENFDVWGFELTSQDIDLLESLNKNARYFEFNTMSSSSLVKMVKFNNGQQYPILGLGTWQTKPKINESEQIEIYNAVKSAIDIGYRHFDCAAFYNNENSIGKAIAEKIKEGVVKREELYITSKLWNNMHKPEEVEIALKNSLNLLGLDYLDLYLIHWPVSTTEYPTATDSEGRYIGTDDSYLDTWKAMEQCAKLGLTKSIGISNFNIKQVKDILEIATIKPVINQIENHPYLTQNKLKEVCESNGILLTAYGPLGSPYRGASSKGLILLDEPIVKQIANKYKKTNAQILLRFQVQRGIVVIPKSSNLERQKENFDIWDFEMSKEDMDLLESLNQNLRYVILKPGMHLKDYPFNEEP